MIKMVRQLSIVVCAFAVLMIGLSHTVGAITVYDYVRINDPPDSYPGTTLPRDINDRGVVVGSSYTSSGEPAGFIFDRGTYTTVIPPGWSAVWELLAINNVGTVVGWGSGPRNVSAFLYNGTDYMELRPPGTEWRNAEVYVFGINQSGVAVGCGLTFLGGRAWLYDKGQYIDIIPPGWDGVMCGGEPHNLSINDKGTVIGRAYLYTNDGQDIIVRTFMYRNGAYTELPASVDNPQGLNNPGTIIGFQVDGFEYSRGNITPLVLPSGDFFAPHGLNNRGLIVGEDVSNHSFVYDDGTFVEIKPPDAISCHAAAINNRGAIVGDSYDGTSSTSFVAIPR